MKTTPLPLVSIGVPTWNYAAYVGEAVGSALAQTYENIEVIVCDNASTDDTHAIVAAFKDPRVKYFGNDENIGVYRNWNRCLHESHGEFFKILQADDRLEEGFVAYCLGAFRDEPEAVLVATGFRNMGLSEERTEWPYKEDRVVLAGGHYWEQMFGVPNAVHPTCQLAKADWIRSLDGYSIRFSMGADYYLWLKAVLERRVVICQPALALQRLHASQDRSRKDNTPILGDMFGIYKEVVPTASEPELAKRQSEKHLRQMAQLFLRRGVKYALRGDLQYLMEVLNILKQNDFMWPAMLSFLAALPTSVMTRVQAGR